MTTEDELNNVVLFPCKTDEPREQVDFLHERSKHLCLHSRLTVDEAERQVRCRDCNVVIDPFDWMNAIAKRQTQMADNVKTLRMEEKQRRASIEKLIQIERNAKARIRRAKTSGGGND